MRRGDVLIRLDTERLDNEIAKRQRAIQAGEEELAELGRLEQLLAHQFESTRAKAEAELAQTREEVRQAKTGRPQMSGWPSWSCRPRSTKKPRCGS